MSTNDRHPQQPIHPPKAPPPGFPPAKKQLIEQSEQVCRQFNLLPQVPTSPCGVIPNHWHISIRRIPFFQSGHIIFIVQPDTGTIDCHGPIEKALGYEIGTSIELEDEITTLAIALNVLLNFVHKQCFKMGRPWSWSTNDEELATRIMRVFNILGAKIPTRMLLARDTENEKVEWLWRQHCDRLRLFQIHGKWVLRVVHDGEFALHQLRIVD
jgi:hypothetical protein